MVLAWGPQDRPTFTMSKENGGVGPATYVTFNSMIDNSLYPSANGDERNFLMIAPDAAGTSYRNSVEVQNGHEYAVRFYIHNNAAENLNLFATGTKARATIPTGTAKSQVIEGRIDADNCGANTTGNTGGHCWFWDEVTLTNAKDFTMAPVLGSARFYNSKNSSDRIDWPNGGLPINDSLFSGGALVGSEGVADGRFKGCIPSSGWLIFKVRATIPGSPNFEVDKKVRVDGTETWSENVRANPGDTLEYRIEYKNTGETEQRNVIVKDTPPLNVNYVPGSTLLKNTANPDGLELNDDLFSANGINIGNYAPGSNAYVYYKAIVPSNDTLEVCGTNTLRNHAIVRTDDGSKEDDVDVIVEKTDCGPPQQECKPGIPEGDARCDNVVSYIPVTGPRALVIVMTILLAASVAGFAYWYVKKHPHLLHETGQGQKQQPKFVRKEESPKPAEKPGEEKSTDFSDIHNH